MQQPWSWNQMDVLHEDLLRHATAIIMVKDKCVHVGDDLNPIVVEPISLIINNTD